MRLDHQTSYFLYGDFATLSANPASQLANYSRSTTGIKNHFENQNIKATIWASQEALRAYVDEQPARGISGPYSVAQANAIANSEKIELIVRSRDNPNLILKREVLIRFTDYDFEPFTGKVVFRKAVPSIDESFNPVFIRISYEVNTGGEKYWLAGTEAQVQLGAFTLGASHVQDQTPYAPYQISGVNAELKISENTNAVVEFARSQGSQFYNRSIESLVEANSGFSQALGGVIPSTQIQSGNAARVEVAHKSQNAQFKLLYSEAEAGFQNSQAAVLPNRQDLAINGQYQVQPDLAVQAQVLSYKDLNAHSKKELARLGIVYEANPALTLEASLKQVKEEGKVGDLSANTTASAYSSLSNLGWANGASSGAGLVRTQTSSATANSSAQGVNGKTKNTIQNEYTSAEMKAILDITKDIQLSAEYEASVNDLTKNRSAVGAQYQLNDNSKMYAKAELNNDLEAQVNGTNIQGTTSRQAVVGIDAEYIKNGQIFSEYRLNDVGQGLNASSAVGLRQLWKVSEAFTLNTGIEQVKTLAYDDSLESARAYNLGFLHQPNSATKWGGKLELRDSNINQQWLGTAAFDYKMSDEWTAIVRDIYIAQNYKLVASNGELTQNQLQAGLAYRDLATNRLSALTKLEMRSENSTALNDEKDNQITVASVHVNYRPLRNVTLQAQAAQKIVRDRVAQHEIRWRASLLAAKVNFELSDIVDVSLMGSVAQSNGTLVRGYGAELGLKLYKNLRLGLSYTAGSYSDLELFSANASWTGWHAKLSMKFDDVPFNGNRQMIN